MNILKDKVIYISLDDWRVVYFKGQNFAEGHRIYDDYLIRLGMLMKEADIDISEIIRIEIDVNDVQMKAYFGIGQMILMSLMMK